MQGRTSRRDLLKGGALAGVGFWVTGRSAAADKGGADQKLNLGIIGVGGKGEANIKGVASENIVALCDVDGQRLAKAAQAFPKAATFSDFRKLLERKDVEAVVVTTPDHTHAVAANAALQLGKHTYCEKPLTHSIYEARVLAATAAKQKVATQMGNAFHSSDAMRQTVELIQTGAVGPVREVHCWTDRPGRYWKQGLERPKETVAVPGTLAWDLWLGPAPARPYNPAYHPFAWRAWWDFGTGALGDMGCHILDAPFWALRLTPPTTVEAEGPPPHAETGPLWCIVRYTFPARGDLPPVNLTWYEAGKLPPRAVTGIDKLPDNGSLFIGEKGKLLFAHGGVPQLLPEAQFAGFKPPAPFLARSAGHHAEWIQACKSGSPTGTNFAYAAALTETVLLGNVAYRAGKKLEWDSPHARATNCAEADRLIRPEFRKGWTL